MNRFPKHFHEGREPALTCWRCDMKLSEAESDAYWRTHPLGGGDPLCFDCASQLPVPEFPGDKRKPRHLVSNSLLGASLLLLLSAACQPSHAGYFIMAALGCANVGILARICKL